MKRPFFLFYGVAAYALFHAAFLYLIGFVANLCVPRSVDVGGPASTSAGSAVVINLLLIAAFGVQHAIMARPAFKAWWTRFVPAPLERSTFVIATCAALGLIYWQWRPLGETVWSVQQPTAAYALWGLCALGWTIALASTFLIDHWELFGLRQSIAGWRGVPHRRPEFVTRGLYRYVRHPLMLGMLLAFWATPEMTLSHLVFALGMSSYVLIGVSLEERDLMNAHPRDYADYRRRTGMLLPSPRRRRRRADPSGSRPTGAGA